MAIQSRTEGLILLAGDILVFVISLWFMLLLRYGQMPSKALFDDHIVPFSVLFVVWIIVFFIAGLYEKHTSLLRKKLPAVILNAQITNIAIAVAFFYLIPYFGITPKTNLFIYLFISLGLVFAWRLYGQQALFVTKKYNALLIGTGSEMEEIRHEVMSNPRYPLTFVSVIDTNDLDKLDIQEDIVRRVYQEDVQVIVADLKNDSVKPLVPHLYNLIFSKVRFVDMYRMYEDIFNRVPLSLVRHNWFLENISVAPRVTYDIFKRLMDIVLGGMLAIASLLVYPCIAIAIKVDGGGRVFFTQERIGKNNAPIHIIKFRSMVGEGEEKKVTRVGQLLRTTRLDELPQLWNVVRGDLSLIGPRPEIPALVKEYEGHITFYNIRHLIKPGLSGWAQLYHDNHPHHTSDVIETKVKLSFDLFYVKNRSFFLDVAIALKTLKKIVSRAGK